MDYYLAYCAQPQDEGHSKEVPSAGRNEEEIAKFTVDEHLSDVERAVLFLNGGQVVQQKHAIVNLPALLRGRGRAAYDAVAQPLRSALNRMDSEAQISVAEAFATIARERLLSPSDMQACLLPMVVRSINKEKSEEETDAWLAALRDMVPHLDKEVLRTEVLSLALSKGDVQDSVNSRIICARILGDVTQHMTKDEIERSFFKKAMAMCQDVDFQVRVSMAAQLATIARAVGRDMAAKFVLDEIFELMNDEELQVRGAALTSLVAVLDMLAADVRKVKVVPCLRQHMQPLELDPLLHKCMARQFGAMLMAVKADLEPEDQQLFLSCFKHLAARGDAELRRLTAQQLHLVLAAAALAHPGPGGGATVFAAQMQDLLGNLVADPDEEVRLAVAANFHEVARVVDRQCLALLTKPMVKLLRDSSQAVQQALLLELASTLSHWSATEEAVPRQDQLLNELLRAILDLEASIQRAWRIQNSLALALPAMALVFSGEQLHEHLLPMAMRCLNSQVAAVRPAAGDGAVALLRATRREKHRGEIFLRLVRELARGRSFSLRMAFGDVLRGMVRRFSARWTKEFAFDLCLELLYDPVPNVRLQMVCMLPSLKQIIKMPEDVDLLERLNNAMANAMTDNDKDVSGTARTCNDAYKRVPLRMGGGTSLGSGGSDGHGSVSVSLAGYEAEDRRKEEEEVELGFATEDIKEIKAEILQVASKKGAGRSRNEKDLESPVQGRAGTRRTTLAGGAEPGLRPAPTSSIASRSHAIGGTGTLGALSKDLGPSRTSASPAFAGNGVLKTSAGHTMPLAAVKTGAGSSPSSPVRPAALTKPAATVTTLKPADRMAPLSKSVPFSPSVGAGTTASSTTPLRLPSIALRNSTGAPTPVNAGGAKTPMAGRAIPGGKATAAPTGLLAKRAK